MFGASSGGGGGGGTGSSENILNLHIELHSELHWHREAKPPVRTQTDRPVERLSESQGVSVYVGRNWNYKSLYLDVKYLRIKVNLPLLCPVYTYTRSISNRMQCVRVTFMV